MIDIGIIGATGYVGIELIRILVNHPNINLKALSSVSFEGEEIDSIYPNVQDIVDLKCTNSETVIKTCDVIFLALPHGLSEPMANECIKNHKLCIDLGADFRLESEEDYKKWYQKEYDIKDIHKHAVYGLPEINKNEIKKAKIIANPGCYPTGAALGLIPLVEGKTINEDTIIIDAKSGTTGAGRKPTSITHFSNCNENALAYGIGTHRHIPEIEQTLSQVSNNDINVTFIPHLIPVNRGILSTMYCDLNKDTTLEEIYNLYKKYYKDEKFIRILPLGKTATIRNVTHSNYCDISIHQDPQTKKIIMISAIDNMLKGAAGQAVQNMNIRMGYAEDDGLKLVPSAF